MLNRLVTYKWAGLFILWAFHGVIALQEFAILFGNGGFTSPWARTPGLLILLWTVFNLAAIILVLQNAASWIKLQSRLEQPATGDTLLVMAVLVFCIQICVWLVRQFLGQQLVREYGGYIDVFLPIIKLTGLVAIEVVILILFFRLRGPISRERSFRFFLTRLLIVLMGLGVVVLIISFTRLGIAHLYKGDWSRGLPAVPLLEWQIALAFLCCLGMVMAESDGRVLNHFRLDLWISLGVWLFAVVCWLSQPVNPSASALEPRAPNFEIYPFIDSQTYDEFAQSALVGNGFAKNKIPQRPLYAAFLVFLHLLVGQEYDQMIMMQSLFFAVFPVLLYLVGTEFIGRPIGISIALLAILRDQLSNMVAPFTGNLTYSKLYLSEIPTAIFLLLFLLIGLRWIRAGFPLFGAFLLGGVLGVGMLIRTQVVVALPVLLLFAFLTSPRKTVSLMKSALLMMLAVTLAVSPWLWRNWRMTGDIIFDSPESQTSNLALRYGRLNGIETDIMPQPGESNSEYNDRLTQTAWTAISSNPGRALWGVANSFLNHTVNNILVFPLRNSLETWGELFVPEHAFWERWQGKPRFAQGILLAFYLFLFGLGLAASWLWKGWLGFLPLGLNLAYNLWTSLALLSGQRFMLTMDWSIYMYYMIGLFALLKGLLLILETARKPSGGRQRRADMGPASHLDASTWRPYLLAGTMFFLVGVSLPLVEMIFPQRYPLLSHVEVLKAISHSPAMTNSAEIAPACLQEFVDKQQLKLVEGRVLYPRFYMPGDGESFTDSFGYKAVDEARLVFNIIGQAHRRVVLPLAQSPDFFPNGADAVLFLANDDRPWFVFIHEGGTERLYASSEVDKSACRQ